MERELTLDLLAETLRQGIKEIENNEDKRGYDEYCRLDGRLDCMKSILWRIEEDIV